MDSGLNEAPFLSKVGKFSTFLINLAVILGGLISFGWLVGSLLFYGKLDRSVWEFASLVVVSFFVFESVKHDFLIADLPPFAGGQGGGAKQRAEKRSE